MIRLVIADDHPVVRQGLRFFLEQQPDMRVVGESSDGKETLEVVASTLPTVVLLDLLMPTMDGVQAIRQMIGLPPVLRLRGADFEEWWTTLGVQDQLLYYIIQRAIVLYKNMLQSGRQ